MTATILYRGKRYKRDKKYPARHLAEQRAEYLKRSRQVARRPYKGKRPPIKDIRVLIKTVVDGRGKTWYITYKREV